MAIKDEATANAEEAPVPSGMPLISPWAASRPAAAPSRTSRRSRGSTYAALDLGTNNCRLLVAEPAHWGFRVIDAFSRIVRLGEGLGRGNTLSADAIERTLEALRICRDKMAARKVARARLVATEACLAENGPAFIDRVREELDIELEVVDRRTEAYLAVTGCASPGRPTGAIVIVFDIGGGSTEIAWLDGWPHPSSPIPASGSAWDSLPVGVVTLAERYGGINVTPQIFEEWWRRSRNSSSISRSSPPRRSGRRISTCSAPPGR